MGDFFPQGGGWVRWAISVLLPGLGSLKSRVNSGTASLRPAGNRWSEHIQPGLVSDLVAGGSSREKIKKETIFKTFYAPFVNLLEILFFELKF